MHLAARVKVEIVPFVSPNPGRRQLGGGRIGCVFDSDGGLLNCGVAHKICASQVSIPGPIVKGIGSGVNAPPSAARLDVMLERVKLGRVGEDITGGVEENHSLILTQVCICKAASVFRGINSKVVARTQSLNESDAVGYRGVSIAGRCGENQHLE